MTSEKSSLESVRTAPIEEVDRRRHAVIVRLAGELDLHSVPDVRKTLLALTDEQPERFVIDLSKVEFIDSTALGSLVEAKRLVESRGSSLYLAAPGVNVRRTLGISGLDGHLRVVESVEQALDASHPEQ